MASNALKALLGVLAVAGYQNRDKITEILKGLRNSNHAGPGGQPQPGGGLGDLLGGGGLSGLGGLGSLGGLFGGGAAGGGMAGAGGLAGGLSDLLRQFEQRGHSETAKSWVQPGENKPIDDRQLSEVLGAEVLDDLSLRTGLSPNEILSRLSRELPTAVDDMTPDGKLPPEDDLGEPGNASGLSRKPVE